MTVRNFIAVLVTCALLSSCATETQRPVPSAAQAPAGFPSQYYRDALERGLPVYRIDSRLSLLLIEVHRAGSLARLGHDHVVASHDIDGWVAPGAGRSDLYVPVDRLVVDEPNLRAQAKFDTQPSEDDIAGTRRNMLKALQSDQFPFAVIAITTGAAGNATKRAKLAITLRGMKRELEAPVQVETTVDQINATGSLALRQTDFGIEPLSILGGAIQVRDDIDLRFSVRARRIWRPSDM